MHRMLVPVAASLAVLIATDLNAQRVRCEAGIAMLSEGDKTFSDLEVDKLAKPRRGNPEPKFPNALRGAAGPEYASSFDEKVTGEVVARFVVDTLGCVDMRTFTIVSTSDSAFTDEVRTVLPRYRYDAAMKDGKKARAWLTWKFLFYRQTGPRAPF